MSKTKTSKTETRHTLYMQDYLRLEIERFREMGWDMPEALEVLLKKRAKALDKQCAAEQARKVYAKEVE